MGVAAALILLAWYGALFYRSLRTSVGAVAIFFSMAPFLMLDKMTYVAPTLMLIAALWVAALDYHWLQRSDAAESPKSPASY